MLRTLKDLFDSFIPSAESRSPQQLAHALQLATAVLLVDVMRANTNMGATERAPVLASLRSKFALADDELARLLELAEDTVKASHDYHRFTSNLNEHFTQTQKVQVVEYMWQVAFADKHLDAHENHLISKIASLLHVTHGEYIAAKMRAKEVAGLA